MNALKALGIGAASSILILLVVIGGYNMLALSLGTVTVDYFLGALAVVILLGGAWLSMQGLGFIGKPFIVGATIVLVAITVRYRVPGVAAYFTQSTRSVDHAAYRAAVDLAAPRTIACDRTTRTLTFFERTTREPLVWVSESSNGRLICWDRSGFHPQEGTVLVAVDERLAARIMAQEPLVSSAPAAVVPTPVPPPRPAPTPLPELGEGPIPK